MRLTDDQIRLMREASYVTFLTEGDKAYAICVKWINGVHKSTKFELHEAHIKLNDSVVVYPLRFGLLWSRPIERLDVSIHTSTSEDENGKIGQLVMTEGDFEYPIAEWIEETY